MGAWKGVDVVYKDVDRWLMHMSVSYICTLVFV